jgi:hypothetical protein
MSRVGFCARKTTESSNLEAKLNQGLTAAPSVLYFAIARFASHINRLLWCQQRTLIVLSYSLSLMIPSELHFRLDFRVYHRNKVEFCCWPLALVRGCLVYHIISPNDFPITSYPRLGQPSLLNDLASTTSPISKQLSFQPMVEH